MDALTLSQVEEFIGHLSYQEQLLLLERLARRLHSGQAPAARRQPALLSDDPPVQAELRDAGDRLLREAEAQQEQTVRAWDGAMAAMGIGGQPIGAEQLQQMLIAEGVNPEDNEFSRALIAMREE